MDVHLYNSFLWKLFFLQTYAFYFKIQIHFISIHFHFIVSYLKILQFFLKFMKISLQQLATDLPWIPLLFCNLPERQRCIKHWKENCNEWLWGVCLNSFLPSFLLSLFPYSFKSLHFCFFIEQYCKSLCMAISYHRYDILTDGEIALCWMHSLVNSY